MDKTADAAPGKEPTEEEAFLARLESSPGDLEPLFAITRNLKKKGEKEKPRTLLNRLASALRDKGLPERRLETLIEISRAFPNKAPSPEEFTAAFREAFPKHPTLEGLLTFYFKPKANLVDASEKVKRWLAFLPGSVFYFAGHGAGRVIDVKPAIESVRLEFEGGEKLSLPPGAAARNLIPLAAGDFRREKLEDPAGLAEISLADPSEAVRHLLESVGKPLNLAEIKAAFAGVIPAESWTAFWNAARRHPQLVLAGTGKNAAYSWSESREAADDSIRREFEAAAPSRRLEIARQNARRKDLAGHFAESLAATAEGLRATEPALATEIALYLEDSGPPARPPFDPRETLADPRGAEVARAIADPSARIRAYRLLAEAKPEQWPRVYAELFISEEDSRALAALDAALLEGAPELREAQLGKILASPRLAPRAFLWLCEKRDSVPGVAPKLGASLLPAVIEALRLPEFSTHRARVKSLFDRGGLALELVAGVPGEEEARRILVQLERAPGLESFRRDDLKQALVRRFPELRGSRAEPLYTTPRRLEEKRLELENLVKVEIPKIGRAIQEAAALGDLSENFEYHSARARQEFLSARAAQLQADLARARPIDPARVDASEVRVGTRVRLAGDGRTRDITILGPWESQPEKGIYSYQTEFAARLLGKKPRESVEIDGQTWEVAEIRPWQQG
jgi:transcription elongation GreA/GreB family factor